MQVHRGRRRADRKLNRKLPQCYYLTRKQETLLVIKVLQFASEITLLQEFFCSVSMFFNQTENKDVKRIILSNITRHIEIAIVQIAIQSQLVVLSKSCSPFVTHIVEKYHTSLSQTEVGNRTQQVSRSSTTKCMHFLLSQLNPAAGVIQFFNQPINNHFVCLRF